MTNTTTTDLVCPLWRRLIALIYDLVAVLAIVMTVGLVCQLATGGQLITTTGTQAHIAWWYRPLQAVVVAGYFVLSWLRGGQTLGMRPWRIRVTTHDGGRLSLGQAVLRAVVAAAPLVMLLLAPALGLRTALWGVLGLWIVWFATGLVDSRRRPVHDLIARTEIRRIG
jgi:uncharacterized RDD family membrane protein YckC